MTLVSSSLGKNILKFYDCLIYFKNKKYIKKIDQKIYKNIKYKYNYSAKYYVKQIDKAMVMLLRHHY